MRGGDIVTVLFTDLVGSTELLGRLGDDAAEEVRRVHFRLLRQAVAARGGHEVKNLGDGLMVVFPSAVDAVGCSVAMQQAVHRHSQQESATAFHIRVGLQVGEPVRDEGDYFGTPVVVAKRLCDHAGNDQILAGELVAALVGSRGGFQFRPIGPVALKGVEGPVAAVEVGWEPTGEVTEPSPVSQPIALPSGLLKLSRLPFVGREYELAHLTASWEEASTGRRRLVLVGGEPGIGKTRLSAAIAETALRDGAVVLFGRCDEESVVPYQPFVEALRQLAGSGTLEALSPRQRGELARLVPELADRLPTDGRPAADPETERFRLFESVAAALTVASRRRLLLVLDDLQWAGKPTMLMLRHVVGALEPFAVLIVGTYRDVELTRAHPLAEALASWRREEIVERIHLSGLSMGEIRELMEVRAGHEFAAGDIALYETVWAEAEGNPFFLIEINRHLVETGRLAQRQGRWVLEAASAGELDLPEGVRDVLGRRLSRLSEAANEALAHAAVLGREFELDVLALMTGKDEDTLLDLIDEAVAARLVVETSGARGSALSFSHALVRETLLAELTTARKERRHLRAAQALEDLRSLRGGVPVSAVATHYRLSGQAGSADKAIDFSLLAGEEAAHALAWEEAAVHWQAALDLMESRGAEPRVRADLFRRLADLMFVTGLDLPLGVAYGEKALALYEELGDEEWSARMHSRLGRDLCIFAEVMDIPRALEHLGAAKVVLAQEEDSPALAYVYVSLSAARQFTMEPEEGLAPAHRAIEIARRLDRPAIEALASVPLGMHLAARGAFTEGRAATARAWEIADHIDHSAAGFHSARVLGLFDIFSFDPEEGRRWLERELAKPRQTQTPNHRRLLQALLAWAHALSGRLHDAQAALDEAPGVEVGCLHAPPLEFWRGHWEVTVERLGPVRDRYLEAGNAMEACALDRWRAEAARLAGDHARAEGLRQAALALRPTALVGPLLHVDAALAGFESGRAVEARAHLEKAAAFMVPAEDWRGVAGRLAMAEALSEASQGNPYEAESAFGRGIETCRRFGLPWEEAEGFLLWGRVLGQAGDPIRGGERFDAAADVYVRCQAAPRWLERLAAERAP